MLSLTFFLAGSALAADLTVQRVPSIEEVVEREGFTPTPSQSDIYRPGAVLAPNARGGHDVIVDDCLEVDPRVSVMSQSSIATSLASGVSARLGVAKGAVAAGIERRLSFVDPEQRTISMAQLAATEACVRGVHNAVRFADLSKALVVYDVLVAQITSSVCTRADASGRVVALGSAEAAAYSECVQESETQVPLGYKAVPLAQLMATVGGAQAPSPSVGVSAVTQGAGWSNSGGFGGASDLAKQLDAAEKLKAELEAKLASCLRAEAGLVQAQARADWADLAPLAVKTDAAAKAAGRVYFEKFVSVYGAVKVSCKNELGERSAAVAISEVAQARAWLDTPAARLANTSTRGGESRVVGRSGYALRLVPAGTYALGCTAGQFGDCDNDEEPSRKVTLSRPVYMGETEVTQGLYQRLMGSNPSEFKSCGENCPVEPVSWYDAVNLSNKLSAAEGLEACYVIKGESVSWPKGPACLGYRLPTEAEWEVAARGGGDAKYSGGNELSAVGWFAGNSGLTTHPVGQKQANGYGLYDLSGNVWEWTWDWYDEHAYAAGAVQDPLGPASGSYRIFRGGDWFSDPQYARIAYRNYVAPGLRYGDLGVRLVRTAP